MTAISIMLLGTGSFPLLSRLTNLDKDKKHYIHCFNVLDYTVPTEMQVSARYYRSELRRAFRLLKSLDTELPEIQLDQLREYDYLDLDDIDLEINSWIQTVFDNKGNYDSVYKYLSGDLTQSNVELVPLLDSSPDLVVFKGSKLAPLRFYYQQKDLLKRDNTPYFEAYSDLQSEDLAISDISMLQNMGHNDESIKALQHSKFLIILASDLVSLGILSKMKTILRQIRDSKLPVILVLPGNLESFGNFAEREIFELIGRGTTLDKTIDRLSEAIDYIFAPKSAADLGEILLETGYQIEHSDLSDPVTRQDSGFIEFLDELQSK